MPARTPRWTVAGASHIGPQHDDNQDRWGALTMPDGRVFAAVSDGAGSAPHAAAGAYRAVLAAMGAARGDLPAADVATAAVAAAVEELAGDRDFAATLTVVVADPHDRTDGQVAIAAVGDSPAMTRQRDRWLLHRNDRVGEYVNETTFLTCSAPAPGVWVVPVVDVDAIVVGTDGLDRPTIGPDGPTAGFYDPLVARAHAGTLDLDALLEWMHQQHRLEDDTTVVMLWQERPPWPA